MSGEHRLAVGLARPRVKMVSCRRLMEALSPVAAKLLSVWNSVVTCESLRTTSFSFISFRMSTASLHERKKTLIDVRILQEHKERKRQNL